MKNLMFGAICAVSMAGAAQAGTLDFFALASGNEGEVSGDSFMVGSVTVTVFNSFGDYAYLDDGAGLGVCQTTDCAGSSDDNVDKDGEYIQLNFSEAVTLSEFVFRSASHPIIQPEDGGVVRVRSNNLLTFFPGFTEIGTLTDITFLRLQFAGTPFYLSAVDVVPSEVPLPATLPMLLAGFGGLGYMARRRKTR